MCRGLLLSCHDKNADAGLHPVGRGFPILVLCTQEDIDWQIEYSELGTAQRPYVAPYLSRDPHQSIVTVVRLTSHCNGLHADTMIGILT